MRRRSYGWRGEGGVEGGGGKGGGEARLTLCLSNLTAMATIDT